MRGVRAECDGRHGLQGDRPAAACCRAWKLFLILASMCRPAVACANRFLGRISGPSPPAVGPQTALKYTVIAATA